MNNKIACINIVVISMLCLFYLIIYYVLSLARQQDKYYLNYIWNLKHTRFVIVRLTWMDQVAIVRNLTCCQYIRL
jgi:hypothetical protein